MIYGSNPCDEGDRLAMCDSPVCGRLEHVSNLSLIGNNFYCPACRHDWVKCPTCGVMHVDETTTIRAGDEEQTTCNNCEGVIP